MTTLQLPMNIFEPNKWANLNSKLDWIISIWECKYECIVICVRHENLPLSPAPYPARNTHISTLYHARFRYIRTSLLPLVYRRNAWWWLGRGLTFLMELKQFHDMGEHILDRAGGLNHVTTPSLCILHWIESAVHFSNCISYLVAMSDPVESEE